MRMIEILDREDTDGKNTILLFSKQSQVDRFTRYCRKNHVNIAFNSQSVFAKLYFSVFPAISLKYGSQMGKGPVVIAGKSLNWRNFVFFWMN